jgi:hypothetical protein
MSTESKKDDPLSEGWAWNKDETGVRHVIYIPPPKKARRTKRLYYVVDSVFRERIPEVDGWNTGQVFDTKEGAWGALIASYESRVRSARKALKTAENRLQTARNYYNAALLEP